jgi:hypothetical protein
MKITLTYQGPLPPKQRGVSPIRADLRRVFHPQIKEQVGHMLGGRSARHVTSVVHEQTFIAPAHTSFRTAVEWIFCY